MDQTALTRLIGGTPAAVAVRLAVTSLLAGVVLAWLDIEPVDLWYGLERAATHLWAMGFGELGRLGRLFAAGAVLVLPIWVLVRILSFRALPMPRHRPEPLPGSPPQQFGTEPAAWRRGNGPPASAR